LGDLGEPRERVRREPEGEVPVMPGEGKGDDERFAPRGWDSVCCSSLRSADSYGQAADVRDSERVCIAQLVDLIPAAPR
jgi:hypothetical protein